MRLRRIVIHGEMRAMSTSLFFVRLIGNRPNFATTMTPEEQAIMGAHFGFLDRQLAAGSLVVAGPVLDPAGVFGMAVFEAESLDAVRALLAADPALAVGHHEIAPMGPSKVRPAHPASA